MRFYLTKRETTHQSIKRIFIELIDGNILLLKNHDDDFDKSIHEARKNFKKLRAVLRLVKSDLDPHFYKTHNIHFRNLSRKISGLRDSFVIIESLQNLVEHTKGNIGHHNELINQLKNNHYETKNRILFEENAPLEVCSSLQFSRDEFTKLPEIHEGFSTLGLGIDSIYTQCKYFLDLTYSQPTSEVFHELRKNVKYLWHLLQIIQPINYRKIKKLTLQFKQLSDFIGDEHDLHELKLVGLSDKADDTHLIKMINTKQFELRAEAWKLGEKLFQQPSEEFLAELENDYANWKSKPTQKNLIL